MVRIARRAEEEDAAVERQTSSLAALALVLALVVAGLYLIEALRASGWSA